ncbi:hypothetical protein FAUST_7632 [Fusarium austroamericanum]|uniref:Uncharacterized protein n=1 Tax=Fusarium austroamericanum TaxID=282268 RepID=A0AAN5Z8B5_FUSAU|nr:hypothetical protein FAUST_7632 [Fusarium austroamericanum]
MQNIPYDTGKPNRTKNLLIRIKGVVGDQGANVAIEKIALVIGEYLPDEPSGFVANGVKLKQPDAFDPETGNYHPTQERSAILVTTIKDENVLIYRLMDREDGIWTAGSLSETSHQKFYFYSEFLQNVTEDPRDDSLLALAAGDLDTLLGTDKWYAHNPTADRDSVKIFQLLLNGQLDDEEDAEDLVKRCKELWDHDCPTQAVLALSQSIGDNALQGMVIDVCLSRALIYNFCYAYKLHQELGVKAVDYKKLAREAYELAQKVVGNPLPVPDDASYDATEYSAARFLDLFIDIKRETVKAVDDLMKANKKQMPDVTLPDADMTKLLSNAMEAGDYHKRMDAIKNILALAMIEHESSPELIQKLDGQELDAMIKMRDALGDCDENEDNADEEDEDDQ